MQDETPSGTPAIAQKLPEYIFFPLHKALFHIMVSCNRSPHEAAHFICCNHQYVPAVRRSYMPEERSVPPPAIESTNPARNTKNILPDKLISLFSHRSLSSTSFCYLLFLLHRNRCRPKNLTFFVHNFSEKILHFPESQLSIRREKFKICIINIYKQTGLFKTISQIKRFSSLRSSAFSAFFILCFNLKNIFIIF